MVYSLDLFDRLSCTRSEKEQCVEIIASILRYSIKARQKGLLCLEYDHDIELIDDALMRKGLQLIVDGTDPETTRDILTNRIFASNIKGIDLLKAIISIEGILAIQEGCNPRLAADMIAAFLGKDIDLWESELNSQNEVTRDLTDAYSIEDCEAD